MSGLRNITNINVINKEALMKVVISARTEAHGVEIHSESCQPRADLPLTKRLGIFM